MTSQNSAPPPNIVLLNLFSGMMKTQAVHHAARLRIAELVKEGPRTVFDLAKATHTHAPSLLRLLRALASIEIFEETEPAVFSQTPLSNLLRSDIPESMHAIALLHGDEWQWHAWEGFAGSLETGIPSFPRLFGQDMWTYFTEDNPSAGRRFQAAMTAFADQVNAAIVAAYDFGTANTLVDIGGGEGTLLTAILKAHPSIHKGILFDRPEVIERLREPMEQAGMANRCKLIAGDFFTSVPTDADIYFMKQIIKDWNDEECVKILTNCRRAMKPGGKILVAETVLFPGKETSHEKFIDLQLMVLLPGQERYEDQFRHIFLKAGFVLTRIVPTTSPYSLLEGVAIEGVAA